MGSPSQKREPFPHGTPRTVEGGLVHGGASPAEHPGTLSPEAAGSAPVRCSVQLGCRVGSLGGSKVRARLGDRGSRAQRPPLCSAVTVSEER